MKSLGVVICTLFAISLCAQDYYSKTYDPFNHEYEEIKNLVVEDGNIYASCSGSCNSDSTSLCYKFVQFDIQGNEQTKFVETEFESGIGFESDNEFLYAEGGNDPKSDKFFIYKINKQSLETELLSGSIPNGYEIYNRSSISNEKHLVVYGSMRDSSDITSDEYYKVKGYQVWLDKVSFEIDTIILMSPSIWFTDIYDVTSDADGNLYSVAIDKQDYINGSQANYLRFLKQNSTGDIVWEYTYPERVNNSLFLSDLSVFENGIVFTGYDSENNAALLKIDFEGNLLWETTFEHDYIKEISPIDIQKSKDGNVLVNGAQRSPYHGWKTTGFISKFNLDSGDLIWERIFDIDRGQDVINGPNFSKFCFLRDIEQLDNGDIVAGGTLDNIYNDPEFRLRHDSDLWLLKLDSMGCLIPNCGTVQLVENNVALNDSCKWLEDSAEWFYTPFSLGFQGDLSKIEIIGDTLIGNRVCSVLGLFDNDLFVEGSDLITFYEFESEKVYFYEDEEFKLIYDFSWSVIPGDTVEYFIPKKVALYDITSSNGDFSPSNNGYKYRFINQEYVDLTNGGQLRMIYTEAIPNDDGDCFPMNRIIGGVGSERGLIPGHCTQLTAGNSEFFRCFESDELTYSEVNGECLITSTNDINYRDLLNIYPNPNNGFFNIEWDVGLINPNSYKLFTVAGQLVQTGIINFDDQYEFDISNQPTGVYFLRLRLDDGREVNKRIVKGK